MKIVFKRWNWKTGQTRTEVPLPKIKNGYISKRAWSKFETALRDLNGKKVRIEVEL